MNNYLKTRIKKIIIAGLTLALFSGESFATVADLVTSVPRNAPAGYANNAHFKAGMINVVDYGATPNNSSDNDGPKIQNALNDARDYHLVCYFPSGTYHINNKLECVHTEKERRSTFMLYGEKGTRPVIKLKSGASGYGNANSPKPLLHIWTRGVNGGIVANNGFNNVVRGVDFDLSGKPGAVGIEFANAQGSTVQDVRINATGAFCGFYRSVGVNGGYFNVEVEGGQYAMYLPGGNDADFFPIFAGCRFYNQTNRVLYIQGRSPVTLVGFHVKKASGPVFETKTDYHEASGNLTLMDGVIEITGAAGTAVKNRYGSGGSKGRTVYMKDVYIRNASDVTLEPNNGRVAGTSGGWTEVKDYGWALSGAGKNGRHLINGSTSSNRMPNHVVNRNFTGNVPSGDTVVGRHIWDEATFPAFSDSDTFNAVIDGGIDNTGNNDVTGALNSILAANNKVFLPKGTYKLGGTLNVPGSTKLFGISKTFSILQPKSGWAPGNEQYVIRTDNNPNASPIVGWLWIYFSHKNGNMVSPIHWRAGKGSIIRDIFAHDDSWSTGPGQPNGAWGLNKKLFRFSGGAGGRVYGICTEWQLTSMSSNHPEFRTYYVDRTTQPLHFYGFNVERQVSTYQAEFNGASNVAVFGGKTEGSSPKFTNDLKPMLGVVDCDNVIIGTVAASVKGCKDGWVKFVNSTNVLGVNFTSQNHKDLSLIKETTGGNTFSLSAKNYQLAVFKRGTATLQHFDTGGSGGNPDPGPGPSGNLLSNGKFDNGLNSWTASNNSQTTTVSGGNAYGGSGSSAQINANGSTMFIEQKVNVVANTDYTVSARINVSGTLSGNDHVKLKADFLNSSGSEISYNNISGNITSSTSGYINYSGTASSPSGASQIQIRITVAGVNSGNVRIDEVRVAGLSGPTSNTDPVISAISDQTTNEVSSITVAVNASDADQDALMFSANGLPSFASFTDNGNGTGSVNVNPNYSSSGVYPITISVDDGNGGSDSESFNLTVNNVNRAPSITNLTNKTMDEGSNLQISLSASDPDADSLIFTASGLSGFGSLTDNGNGTGLLELRPVAGDAGSYSITVTVNDGNSNNNTDSSNFALTVNAAPPSGNGGGSIYGNDFSVAGSVASDFAGDTSFWTVSGGKLKPTNIWRTIYLNTPGAAELTDYVVEVDATTITPGTYNLHTAAVILRYQSSSQYYQVQVDKLGELHIRKKNAGWTTLAKTTGGNFGSSFPRTDNYYIIVSGGATTTIEVYLNGASTPSLSATDSNAAFTQGPPAFEARGMTTQEYDNFNVSFPLANEVLNGDFETGGLSDWNSNNASQTETVSGGNAFGGNGTSGEIVCNNSTVYLEQQVSVTANSSYSVSAHINVNGVFSGGDNVKFKADFRDSSGNFIAWNNISGAITSNTGGYTNYSDSLVAPAGAVNLNIRIVAIGVNSGFVRIDEVSVVEE